MKTYSITINKSNTEIKEALDGPWVKHEDFKALEGVAKELFKTFALKLLLHGHNDEDMAVMESYKALYEA